MHSEHAKLATIRTDTHPHTYNRCHFYYTDQALGGMNGLGEVSCLFYMSSVYSLQLLLCEHVLYKTRNTYGFITPLHYTTLWSMSPIPLKNNHNQNKKFLNDSV